MATPNQVAYQTLATSKQTILTSCDEMISNIKDMKNIMSEVNWTGSSAKVFMENWETNVTDVARSAKKKLSEEMERILTTWSSEFETAEQSIQANEG